mmetsp:Transcript_34391/g.88973  ORF Transcript_34391/g.88973 Transcript_34391/m.88973 type:complete len:243 (-) Transcript_34391:1095-1823(-)
MSSSIMSGWIEWNFSRPSSPSFAVSHSNVLLSLIWSIRRTITSSSTISTRASLPGASGARVGVDTPPSAGAGAIEAAATTSRAATSCDPPALPPAPLLYAATWASSFSLISRCFCEVSIKLFAAFVSSSSFLLRVIFFLIRSDISLLSTLASSAFSSSSRPLNSSLKGFLYVLNVLGVTLPFIESFSPTVPSCSTPLLILSMSPILDWLIVCDSIRLFTLSMLAVRSNALIALCTSDSVTLI